MNVESSQESDHPQTASFHILFPKSESQAQSDCMLSTYFKELWRSVFQDIPITFKWLSAKSPNFSHQQSEIGGNDYSCSIHAHFKQANEAGDDICINLGLIPYPEKTGEFVLQGNRYIFPIYLRTSRQYKKLKENLLGKNKNNHENSVAEKTDPIQRDDERKTDNLHVVLFHELIEHSLKKRLKWVLEKLKRNKWEGDARSLRMSLRSWLKIGNNTLIHQKILRYGQLIDQDSPLNRIFQRKELSFYGQGGQHPDSTQEFFLRDVDDDDLYRICPVVTPQGHKVGMRLFLARRAAVDPMKAKILKPDRIEIGDSLSDAASLIPFIEHDDVSRALMGANMMKQALPLEHPDIPLIQSGWEKEIGKLPEIPSDINIDGILSLGKNLLAGYLPWGLETFEDGIVVSESASKALTSKVEKTFCFSQEKKTLLEGDYCITQITRKNQRISEANKNSLDDEGIIKVGTEVRPGDTLVSAVRKRYNDINKTKTLDLAIISDDFIESLINRSPLEDRDVSLRMPPNFKGSVIEIINLKASPKTSLPPNINRKVGVKVRCIQPVKVGDKIASRHGAKGVVVNIIPDAKMPYMKTNISFCEDDKCSVKTPHRHLQVILNPLGVTGRLNLGQLFETTLAKIAEKQNHPYEVKPFDNNWNLDKLSKSLSGHGFSEDGKEQLYVIDGDNEKPLKYRSLVGPQYFLNLYHQADGKIQAREVGRPYDYTLREGQPRAGKRVIGDTILGSGQRIGEMETWALAAHSAWNTIDDLLNFKSDDRRLQMKASDQDFQWNGSRRPQALVNLILLCRSMGLDLKLLRLGVDVTERFIENIDGEIFDNVSITIAESDQIKYWGRGGEVKTVNLYAQNKKDFIPPLNKLHPDPEGLYSRRIFDPRKPWQMGLIVLTEPIKNPLMEKIDEECKYKKYMLSCIPVLPIAFRKERLGFYKNFQDDLNILYRYVIRRNDQFKLFKDNKKADKDHLIQAEERLYNSVKNLFFGGNVDGKNRKGIANIMGGKKGLIRGHLAGKRADYSGRAVIIGDPHMPLNEAGIPNSMWNQLFPGLGENEKPIILLNRQPSLHRNSIQAFRASWHCRGDVICLNPFVCRPFNADFDGDTIAVHVPQKPEAIAEAEKLIPARHLLSQSNGKVVLGFDKDIALAAAYLTYDLNTESDEDVPLTDENELPLKGRDFWEKQNVNGIETTVGRLVIRRIFGEISFMNRTMNIDQWRHATQKLINTALRKDPAFIESFTLSISNLFHNTLKASGLSLSLMDFQCFSDIKEITYPSMLWLMRQIGKYGTDLEKQITKERGPMRRPERKNVPTEPIKSNLINGHTEEDYFISAHGARAGLVDKGLITAHSGHLLRDWIYRLQHLYIVEKDCRTVEGIDAENIEKEQILGNRFDLQGRLIDYIEKGTQFRSPLNCQGKDKNGHPGICQKCYGYDPSTRNLPEVGLPVGIMAAQALGERVSQETLKSFHEGGKVQEEKKGLELVTYLRESMGKNRKRNRAYSEALQEIYEQFSRGSRPNLVHFEVILKGYMENIKSKSLLSELAHSQATSKFADMASGNTSDDLYGVISRIISGRTIDTGPIGAING